VNFKPFVLTDINRIAEELEGGGTRYKFDYTLANYEIGDRTMEIPRVIFRYQKALAPGTKEPSTAEMQVPPLPLAVRSTLNQPAKQSWIQESLPLNFTLDSDWLLSVGLGLAGMLISIVPLMLWAYRHVPRWRTRERLMSKGKFMQQCSKSLDSLGRSLENAAEVKRQYQALENVTHQYVHYFWNVEAAGLTGGELTRKLEKLNVSAKQRELFSAVLDHGQNCRYAKDNGGQWGNAFQQDLREMRNVVGSKTR